MGCQAAKGFQTVQSINLSAPQAQNDLKLSIPPNNSKISRNQLVKLEPLAKNMASKQYSQSARQIKVGRNLLAGMTCQNLGGASLDSIPEINNPKLSLLDHSQKPAAKNDITNENPSNNSISKKQHKTKLKLPRLKEPDESKGEEKVESSRKLFLDKGLQSSLISHHRFDFEGLWAANKKAPADGDRIPIQLTQTCTALPNKRVRVVSQRPSSAEKKARAPIKVLDLNKMLEELNNESAIDLAKKSAIKQKKRRRLISPEQEPQLIQNQLKSPLKIVKKPLKTHQRNESMPEPSFRANLGSISDRLVTRGFAEDKNPKSGEFGDSSTAFPSCPPKPVVFVKISVCLKSVFCKSEKENESSPRLIQESEQLQKAHMDSEGSAVLEVNAPQEEVLRAQDALPATGSDRNAHHSLADKLERDSARLPVQKGNFSLAALEPGSFKGLKRKFGGRIVKFNSSARKIEINNRFSQFESARLIASPKKSELLASHKITSHRQIKVPSQAKNPGFTAAALAALTKHQNVSVDFSPVNSKLQISGRIPSPLPSKVTSAKMINKPDQQ